MCRHWQITVDMSEPRMTSCRPFQIYRLQPVAFLTVDKYRQLLRLPGAPQFVIAGFIGRLPIATVSLGILLLVTGYGESYAVAGGLAATFALASAFISPLGLRWVDRTGQHRAVPWLVLAEASGLILLTVSVADGWSLPIQFALAAVSGATAPHVGSLVRARWAGKLSGQSQLSSAFALEAVVDELVFILGPPLVTVLALQIGEVFAMFVVVLLLVSGSLWLVSQRATQPDPQPRVDKKKPERMWSATLVLILLLLLLLGGVFGSFEVTTVAYAKFLGVAGLTGILLALYAVGSLISGLLVGARSPVATWRTQLIIAAAALATVGIPLVFVDNVWLLASLSLLAGTAVAPILIATTSLVERAVPSSRLTEALGLSVSGLAVGIAFGTTLSGALVDAISANAGYWLMAGCGIGLLMATLLGMRQLDIH